MNLVVQSAIKNFDIPSASHLMEEEGDEQLTASDYASDMDIEEDVDVDTLTSISMHRQHVTLGEAVEKNLGHWFGLPAMVANDGLCTRSYALT